jgi:hypothetical protein
MNYEAVQEIQKKALEFFQQKIQAIFRPVPATSDIQDVNEFLRGKPNHAIALQLTEEQVRKITEAYTALNALLIHKGYSPKNVYQITAECKPNAKSKIVENKCIGPMFRHATRDLEIDAAALKLANSYREAVDSGFDGEPYEILYVEETVIGPHLHEHAFRYASYGLGDPEETTEFPGLVKNRRGPPSSALFFGPGFWHGGPQSKRSLIVAISVPQTRTQPDPS